MYVLVYSSVRPNILAINLIDNFNLILGLLADKAALTKVLLRHVVPGSLFCAGITTGKVTTAGGEQILLKGKRMRTKRGANAKVLIEIR